MKIIVSIIIVAIIALVVGFVPIMEVPYTETVQYQDMETYYEDEPYEDTEVYYETEPYKVTETYYEDEPYQVTETYTEDVRVEMEILDDRLVRDFLLFVRGKVKNTGDVTLASIDLTIWVEYEVEGLEGRTFRQPGGIGLSPATFKPGEVRDFSVLVQDGTTKYSIIPPTNTKTVQGERTITKYRQVEKERTVTQYREVEKERPVTKYRQVEKERTVTKERLETHYKKVPIFEYLLSRF